MSSFIIPKKEEEETIDILFSKCSGGGYHPSKKAVELFNERKKQINPDFIPIVPGLSFLTRHDPVLVQIFREIGVEFNGKYCSMEIETIPKKYENFYYVREYDGEESIHIDYDKYKLESINNIITNCGMCDEDKIKLITHIFLYF
jgi:hypothetical protein